MTSPFRTTPATYMPFKYSVEALQWPIISSYQRGIDAAATPMRDWLDGNFEDFWRDHLLWGRDRHHTFVVPPEHFVVKLWTGKIQVMSMAEFTNFYDWTNPF